MCPRTQASISHFLPLNIGRFFSYSSYKCKKKAHFIHGDPRTAIPGSLDGFEWEISSLSWLHALPLSIPSRQGPSRSGSAECGWRCHAAASPCSSHCYIHTSLNVLYVRAGSQLFPGLSKLPHLYVCRRRYQPGKFLR